MVYAVYAHRDNSEHVIFDRDLADPPEGSADDYDCVGVFRAGFNARFARVDGRFVLCGPPDLSAVAIVAAKSHALWTRD